MPVFCCMYVCMYFDFQEPLHPEDEISPTTSCVVTYFQCLALFWDVVQIENVGHSLRK